MNLFKQPEGQEVWPSLPPLEGGGLAKTSLFPAVQNSTGAIPGQPEEPRGNPKPPHEPQVPGPMTQPPLEGGGVGGSGSSSAAATAQ